MNEVFIKIWSFLSVMSEYSLNQLEMSKILKIYMSADNKPKVTRRYTYYVNRYSLSCVYDVITVTMVTDADDED